MTLYDQCRLIYASLKLLPRLLRRIERDSILVILQASLGGRGNQTLSRSSVSSANLLLYFSH